MNKWAGYLKNNVGAVFFWAMLTVGILGIMAGSLAKVMAKDVFMAQYLKYSTQAFFLADAGINHALSQLKSDFTRTSGINRTIDLGPYDGSYSVTITSNGGNKVATSVGTVRGSTRTLVAEFSGPPSYEAFNYAAFANRNVSNASLLGFIIINGDVFANADVTLETLIAFIIDINASGGRPGAVYAYNKAPTIHAFWGQITADGGFHKASSMVQFPTIDFEYYRNLAQNGGLYYSSSQNWRNVNLNPGNGVTYVNGSVTFQRSLFNANNNITGCLVANGGVSINALTRLTHARKTGYSNLPAILCQGDLGGLGTLNFNGLVYSKGGNISSLFGAKTGCMMASRDVTLNGPFGILGAVNLTWSLENPPGLTQSPVTMAAWSE